KSISKSRQAYNVMTNNINHFKQIVDLAWERHTHDAFRAPTIEDITSLLKTCLMPLALKTQNDSFKFVSELKQEMFADLEYVQSLEKEIDELESEKVDFSNIYDLLLQECILNDVMCSYLHSLSDLDAYNEFQCLYLHKVRECECLAEKLSKQTENLPQTSRNTNPRVSTSTGVINNSSVSRPHLRSTQMKDKVMQNNSQVKFKKTKLEDHHRNSSISNKTKSVTACNDSLKSRTSNVNDVCVTCGKCVFNSNHDSCVSKFLNDVNARSEKSQVVPIRTRKHIRRLNQSVTTPPKKTVASDTIQKSKSYFRILITNVLKLTNTLGSNLSNVPSSSISLVDYATHPIHLDNQDHNNEPSSSKLVLIVSPPAHITDSSQQELDLLFGPLYDEFFTSGTSSVNKSSSLTDNSTQQDTHPLVNASPTTEPITPTTIVHAEEKIDNQAEDAHFEPYEFINPFTTPMDIKTDFLNGSLKVEVYVTQPDSGFELTTFSNDDHVGCIDTCKSTSGGVKFLGEKLVSWISKKHDCIVISSTKAEYVALSASCAQVMWMRTQLEDYGFN
ncbi:hypothetical protein Tco_0407908, partial [Tanacetum coccineum]